MRTLFDDYNIDFQMYKDELAARKEDERYFNNEDGVYEILFPKEVEVSDNEVYEFINDELEIQWNYELMYELKRIDTTNTIISIANIGTWQGKRTGYAENDSIEEAVQQTVQEYNILELDRYDLTMTAIHHDGTNYITFRERKNEISDEQWENFLDKIYYNKVTKKDISRYTKSLKKQIENAFGF